MEDFQMYSQIQQLKKQGFSRDAVARQLKLNWRTVDHYWEMAVEDYEGQRARQSSSGLDSRKDIILTWLKKHEAVSAAQIKDWLSEHYQEGRAISESSARSISKALELKLTELFTPIDKDARLASQTIRHHHRLISSILATAVKWQIILSNPADRVQAPRVKPTTIKVLDDVETRQLIEQLQDAPIQYRTMITLLIYTGIRRGELLGLKWSDIDFKTRVLQISRATQYLPGKGVFEKQPKSSSSIRAIKLSGIAIQLLIDFRKTQAEVRIACRDMWQDNGLIFTRWNGTMLNSDDLTRWFRKYTIEHHLPKVCIHSLRHTNASLLIAAGTDVRTVSRRLGHAQTSTTMNIYASAIRSADEAAAVTLQNILEPIGQNARFAR